MKSVGVSVSIGIAALLLLIAAPAAANLLSNGGFEANQPPAGGYTGYGIGSTGISGWTVVNHDGSVTDNGHNVIVVASGVASTYTPFGNAYLDLTGSSDTPPFDGVSHLVSTVVGQAYSLSFYLGANSGGGGLGGPIGVTASAGPTATAPVTSSSYTDPVTAGINDNGTIWTQETLNFTATSASTVLTIIGTAGVYFVGLDNVDLELAGTPVSEPGALVVLVGGLVALGTLKFISTAGRRMFPVR